MKKGYSVPRDFSWIENHKLKAWFLDLVAMIVVEEVDPRTNELQRFFINTLTKLDNLVIPFPLTIVLVRLNIILFRSKVFN